MNKKEILCAVAHVSPVFLNLNETIDKASTIINEAAGNNASLIAFPEAFIPGFPYWSAISMPIANHDLFLKLYEN